MCWHLTPWIRLVCRLAAGGSLAFVGFDALSGSGDGDVGFIPPSAASEDTRITISHPDAAVLVSKLTKRDATTKFKALRGLAELLAAGTGTGDCAVALDVIKHWPRIYRRLTLDVDRRVRAQTQLVNGLICKQAGKKLMPQLKNLIG